MSDWKPGRVVAKKQWNERLISLSFATELPPFKAGQFTRVALDIDGERVGRPYSLINAPDDPIAEIYFNIVPEGPLSPRLAALDVGDTLWVYKTTHGFLTLDELPPCRDLWLLATGTAVGPFLSILKTTAPWERFERVILIHAVRTPEELTYQETIKEISRLHAPQFRFQPVLSRREEPWALHGRISNLLNTGALETALELPISATTSHLMLCGNSGMIETTSAILTERGLHKHKRREPGHFTTEKYH